MFADNFERSLPRLLDELADEHTPDYYADLFSQTARTSQRSAWTIPERWLPMLVIERQTVLPRVPWRPIVVLILLVAALAAGLALAASQRRPPPLTGPAGNGLVVLSRDGDLLTYDPRTGATVAIVTGPETDLDPVWSQDGTKVLFRREPGDQPDADVLMIVQADGTKLTQITPEPMTGLTSAKVSPIFAPILRYALSPDGLTVAMIPTIKGIPTMYVVDIEDHRVTPIQLPAIPMSVAFNPTGKDILFAGSQGWDGSYAGLYVIGADGTNLRTLVEPHLDTQVHSRAYWSPDGTRIAYGRREPGFTPQDDERRPAPTRHDLRIHVISADGTDDDRIVGHKDGAWWESPTGWSPDGHRLLIERSLAGDEVGAPYEAAIIDVDGRAPDVIPEFTSAYDWFPVWSPDGKSIITTPSDSEGTTLQQQIWDATTGKATTAPWAGTSHPAMQRVAP